MVTRDSVSSTLTRDKFLAALGVDPTGAATTQTLSRSKNRQNDTMIPPEWSEE